MTKGQMEMIGLVIIVVLLVIGALFYVKFSVFGSNQKREESTVRVTQAYNLMNALLNIALCEKPLKEALIACKEQPSEQYCEGKDACAYVKEKVPTVVDPILHQNIGAEYLFEAKKGEEVFLTFGNCEIGTNSPPLRFGSQGRQYQAYFKLCALNSSPSK